MTAAEIITWVVLPIAIGALVLSFTFLMQALVKKERLLVGKGIRDKELIAQYNNRKAKTGIAGRIISKILEVILLAFLLFVVILGIYSAVFSNDFPIFGVQAKLIGSNSMASVHENNRYYVEGNKLNNRFAFDDLIIINSLPEEDGIKLYDIVTYEDKEGRLIIHRIVSITDTSDGRLFYMRGDANPANDALPIKYSDMRGIYKGVKLTGFGAVIRFVQSGFGIISIVMCLYICVLEEVMSRKIKKADKDRLVLLLENAKKRAVPAKRPQEAVPPQRRRLPPPK